MGTCGYWLRLLGPAPRTRASAGEKRVGISRTQLRSAKNAVGKSGPGTVSTSGTGCTSMPGVLSPAALSLIFGREGSVVWFGFG